MAYCSVCSSYYSPFNYHIVILSSQIVILSEAKDLIAAYTIHNTHLATAQIVILSEAKDLIAAYTIHNTPPLNL